MKVIIAKAQWRGKKLNLPEFGETDIPADGRLEIEDDELAASICTTGDFTIEGEEAEGTDEGTGAWNEMTKEQIEESLKSLDRNDLLALAKEGKMKGAHLIKDDDKLRTFILNKLTQQPTQ
jgi:hypothetical protein